MATTKKLLKQYNVSQSMAKRLAHLSAGITPHYGTSMQALEFRGLVERIDGEAQLTEEGRKVIEGLRAGGW
jgi:ribosomal protein S19E (S16A)